MLKELSKEVSFGKAIARITVTMFSEKKYWDGLDMGEEVITSTSVKIIADGKVVEKGFFASVLEFSNLTDNLYHKHGLDTTKKYTRVGNRAITVGAETANLINTLIEEMKTELAIEFGIETEAQKQQRGEIEEAKAVIKQAEKEGIQNLMTNEEIKVWRKRYNDLYNEGGEGYIPVKVSQEQYQRALDVLSGKEVV